MTRRVLCYATLAIAICCSGCGQADIEEDNIRNTIAAIPMPPPKLYLYLEQNPSTSEYILSTKPDENIGQIRLYLYGKEDESIHEWVADPGGQTLSEKYTYDLLMGSLGKTHIAVQFILRKNREDSTLASDSFAVNTDKYQHYKNTIITSPIAVAAGDLIVLRLTATGSDFAIACGGRESSVSIFSPTVPSKEIVEERTEALTWAAKNFMLSEGVDILTSDLFANFKDNLDGIILSDNDGSWLIGWGLTESKKPYSAKWSDREFSVLELSVENAQEMGVEEMVVTFQR